MIEASEDFPQTLAYLYRRPGGCNVVFVAEAAGQILGMIDGTFDSDLDHELFDGFPVPDAPHAFITRMHVHESVRSGGRRNRPDLAVRWGGGCAPMHIHRRIDRPLVRSGAEESVLQEMRVRRQSVRQHRGPAGHRSIGDLQPLNARPTYGKSRNPAPHTDAARRPTGSRDGSDEPLALIISGPSISNRSINRDRKSADSSSATSGAARPHCVHRR